MRLVVWILGREILAVDTGPVVDTADPDAESVVDEARDGR